MHRIRKPTMPSRSAPGDDVCGVLLRAGLLALLLALFASTPAWATSGGALKLPQKGVSASGLTLSVDTSWVDGYGYRPIRVTVASANPTKVDKTVTFRVMTSWWSDTPRVTVDQDIDVPAGSTSLTATVLVPQFQQWGRIWWDVLVDGKFDKQLSLDKNAAGAGGNAGPLEDGQPRMLLVGNAQMPTAVPNAAGQITLPNGTVINPTPQTIVFPGAASPQLLVPAGTVNLSGSFQAVAGVPHLVSLPPADLPTDWLAYTALDTVLIDVDALVQLSQQRPTAFAAMLAWTRAGGNLWAHGVGDNWDQLDRLAELVGVREEEGLAANQATLPDLPPGWQLAHPHLGDRFEPFQPQVVDKTAVPVVEQLVASPQATAFRRLKLGAVLASKTGPDKFAGYEWNYGAQSAMQWSTRHGLVPEQANPSFANLLIPGVGLAPVNEFRVLITLFVLLIGPVTYWLLRRARRLHLMILVVPLASLVVICTLFFYALISDGLSTRVRAQSYTLLDQRQQTATCWSRLSYYAGLAPSDGLVFPRDTAVYPILSGWNDIGGFAGEIRLPPRDVEWGSKQFLTQGWLNSRTPTQYLTLASRSSKLGLKVRSAKGRCNVTNQLGEAIKVLVLRDTHGDVFWGESIPDGQEVSLQTIDERVASRDLRELFQGNAPEFPEAYGMRTNSMFGGPYRSRQNRARYAYEMAGQGTGRLEQAIRALVDPGLGTSERPLNLQDQAYVAVTAAGPEVNLGLEEVIEEASFHVVHGMW